MDITYTVAKKITGQTISDQLITAFEGGSNYWAQGAYLQSADVMPTERPWYSCPIVFDGDFIFELHYDDPDQEEGAGKGRKTIGQKEVAAGLQIFADKYPAAFAEMIAEEGDASTADLFLQCIVFGDAIYG